MSDRPSADKDAGPFSFGEWLRQAGLTPDERVALEAANWVAKAESRYAAAAALHAPVRAYNEFRFKPWCAECSQGFTAGGDDPPSARRVYWPCHTAEALGLVDPLAPRERPIASEKSDP